MPRLGSKKSRNGCQQCKARRVKCDENRPCGNCARYRVECSLLSKPLPTVHPESRPSPTVTTTYAIREAPNTPRPPTEPSASPASSHHTSTNDYGPSLPHPPSAEVITGGWMQDLELMHHYTAHAYLTMPGVEQAKQTWGYAVPQQAFKYQFLMHSILAYSANHLAHINPSRGPEFRLLASTHQTAAITSLNHALRDVNANNCHALFAGASLITVNAFADAGSYSLDALIEIFQLLRGMNFILQTTEHLIEKGPFSVLLRPLPNPPKPPPLLSSFLVDIQSLACIETSSPSVQSNERVKAIEALREALAYSIETSGHPALRTVMLWPIRVENDFIEALKSRTDPYVRKLFLQYCRVLEYASTDWWFVAGWRSISQQL